jgi:hypothetical protein
MHLALIAWSGRPLLCLAVMLVATLVVQLAAPRHAAARQLPTGTNKPQLKVFLDCDDCYEDFLRSEVEFVDYVRDRTEADVHLLVRQARTASGGLEYTLEITGQQDFAKASHTLRTVTTSSDTDDVIRRQLAAALRVGLLRVLTSDAVPPELQVSVRLGSEEQRPAVIGDRWNNWVFSVRGSASFQGEESSRQRQIGASFSADRITPDWKITLGADLDHEHEEFDLDEEDPVSVEREERDFNGLIVKSLGEHWSAGALGEVESSTFDNIELSFSAAPAVEFNVFPYSQHTRRQLRVLYGAGISRFNYFEETLYGKTEETLPMHELSITLEQRERWGSLQARTEWSQYLHDLSKNRLELEGELSIRLARGLSVGGELNATRLRDQLSLPLRGATDEEVLLRLRRLESGYDYGFSFSLTYTFGSIFSSIVNPRFGN